METAINHKYKHVIWDWNGTLINDAQVNYELCVDELKRCGMAAITFEEYQRNLCHPFREFYRKLGFDFNKYSYSDMASHFHHCYVKRLSECKLFPDALEILNAFKNWGVTQSILSALPQDILLKSVTERGLADFFTDVVGFASNEAGSKVENGIAWFKSHTFKPDELLMIGDTCHDYEVASSIGIDCILVARGGQHYDNLVKTGSPVLMSLAELHSYLLESRNLGQCCSK